MSKISKIGDHKTGIQYLQDEANGGKEEKKTQIVPPTFPEGKCLKLRCILEGVDYYIPDGAAGIDPSPPYHPFGFNLGYSVVMEQGALAGKDPVAIIKHTEKRFFQTGVSTEIVDLPKWWDRRDGGI